MKKKVLFVNGHLNVGGVEKSLIDILKNFNFEKYEVDLILFEDLGDYYNELPNEVNCRFIDITKTYGSMVKCLAQSIKNKDFFSFWLKIILIISNKINSKLFFLIKYLFKISKKYDCAIAFRVGFCAEVVAHCVDANFKFVWWHHGECNYDGKTKIRMANTFNYFDKVVSVSGGCKKMIEHYFGNLSNKVIVIPNMIDIDEINQKSNEFNPYESEKNNFKIVTVGRMSPEKNMLNIIYIAKHLLEQNYFNFKWHVIGNGVEFEKVKSEIGNYELNDYVILEGEKTNPYPYIKNADLMVHTSFVESQCLTVLEAFSLSVPCIVTESIGPKEFIINGINGILTGHDSRQIADEIINLINNDNVYYCIKRNTLRVVKNNYSTYKIINMIENLIDNGGIN